MNKIPLALLAMVVAVPARALDLEAQFGPAAQNTQVPPAHGAPVFTAPEQGAPIVEPLVEEAEALRRLMSSYLRRDWGGFVISGGRLYAAPIEEGRLGRRRRDAVEIYRGFQTRPLTINLEIRRPDVASALRREIPFAAFTEEGLAVRAANAVDAAAQFERERAALRRVLKRAFERTGGWRGAEGQRLTFKAIADWAVATRVALPQGGRAVSVEYVMTREERTRLRVD